MHSSVGGSCSGVRGVAIQACDVHSSVGGSYSGV